MYVESLEAIEATWEDLFRDCHHSCIITVKVVLLNGEEEIDLIRTEARNERSLDDSLLPLQNVYIGDDGESLDVKLLGHRGCVDDSAKLTTPASGSFGVGGSRKDLDCYQGCDPRDRLAVRSGEWPRERVQAGG
ncbi:hypothetical protein BGZ91_005200 [Linnemannia elongata]|nr:hypothetical protein BGZ91_005200 [Linnemannia elongata]